MGPRRQRGEQGLLLEGARAQPSRSASPRTAPRSRAASAAACAWRRRTPSTGSRRSGRAGRRCPSTSAWRLRAGPEARCYTTPPDVSRHGRAQLGAPRAPAQCRRAAVVFFVLSGAAALVYQVAWQRLLALHDRGGRALGGHHHRRVHGRAGHRLPPGRDDVGAARAAPLDAGLRAHRGRRRGLRRDQRPPLLLRPLPAGRVALRRARPRHDHPLRAPCSSPPPSWGCRCRSSSAGSCGTARGPRARSGSSTPRTPWAPRRGRSSRPGCPRALPRPAGRGPRRRRR